MTVYDKKYIKKIWTFENVKNAHFCWDCKGKFTSATVFNFIVSFLRTIIASSKKLYTALKKRNLTSKSFQEHNIIKYFLKYIISKTWLKNSKDSKYLT